MVNNSTDYYRQNKRLKLVVHECPHCDYCTTGPKISLKHHIDAKHTEESEKPFQCDHCERGFAQKAALINHISNIHNIDVNIKTYPELNPSAYTVPDALRLPDTVRASVGVSTPIPTLPLSRIVSLLLPSELCV